MSRFFDFAQIHSVGDMAIFRPKDIHELRRFLANSSGPIALKGAGYSHGGHTLIEGGTQIDMKDIKGVQYHERTQTMSILAGTTWCQILRYLASYGRTVAEMQSYHNFSVGGSISVNVHGRGLQFGTISETVVDLIVMLTDGSTLLCSRTCNSELFWGVIGGYGLVGIIVSATLLTVSNERVRLEVSTIPTKSISSAIRRIFDDKNNVLSNANIYPGNFGRIVCFAWKHTRMPFTHDSDVDEYKQSLLSAISEPLVRRVPLFKMLRAHLEPTVSDQWFVVKRSFAAASDVQQLSVPMRWISTTVLQEYFVPVRFLQQFLAEFLSATRQVNTVNISLRYVRKTQGVLLNFAPEDMISVVLYLNLWNTRSEFIKLTRWTNERLQHLSKFNGKIYLPYLLVYEPDHIFTMFPGMKKILALKHRYDPDNRLKGMFYDHVMFSRESRI